MLSHYNPSDNCGYLQLLDSMNARVCASIAAIWAATSNICVLSFVIIDNCRRNGPEFLPVPPDTDVFFETSAYTPLTVSNQQNATNEIFAWQARLQTLTRISCTSTSCGMQSGAVQLCSYFGTTVFGRGQNSTLLSFRACDEQRRDIRALVIDPSAGLARQDGYGFQSINHPEECFLPRLGAFKRLHLHRQRCGSNIRTMGFRTSLSTSEHWWKSNRQLQRNGTYPVNTVGEQYELWQQSLALVASDDNQNQWMITGLHAVSATASRLANDTLHEHDYWQTNTPVILLKKSGIDIRQPAAGLDSERSEFKNSGDMERRLVRLWMPDMLQLTVQGGTY